MRKLAYVAAAVVGLAGAWIYISVSEDNKQTLKDHPCINDYGKCRNLKELIDFYPPVYHARIECIGAARKGFKYGEPEWPGIMEGMLFESHLMDEKIWRRTGQITLVQENAMIPNAFGGKERKTMYCRYDLNTKEVVSIDAD